MFNKVTVCTEKLTGALEYIKKEILDFLDLDENKDTTYQTYGTQRKQC